jgi:hypothetical protein
VISFSVVRATPLSQNKGTIYHSRCGVGLSAQTEDTIFEEAKRKGHENDEGETDMSGCARSEIVTGHRERKNI